MENIQLILNEENDSEDNPLRCAVCKNFLSVSPIFLNNNLGSICGRENCMEFANSKGVNCRQKAFEAIAMFLEFPCMHKAAGCKEKLPWNEIGEHEKLCEFANLLCPLSSQRFEDSEGTRCEWKGDSSELLKHMEEIHPSNKFDRYVQIDLRNNNLKNCLFFSRMEDCLVILVIVMDPNNQYSFWKAWTCPNIWGELNYRIKISTEKGQLLTYSKSQRVDVIHPAFLESKINKSWFKINFDDINRFFDSPHFVTTIFYINGFIVGPVPDQEFNHKHHSQTFKMQDNYLKLAVRQCIECCRVCSKPIDCLSSHLNNDHKCLIFKLNEYIDDFDLGHYFFSFDDHIFVFSKKLFLKNDFSFSLECLQTRDIKYKYELKFLMRENLYSSLTLSNLCFPGLIDSKYVSNGVTTETLIPKNIMSSIFPSSKDIKFKLSISKI